MNDVHHIEKNIKIISNLTSEFILKTTSDQVVFKRTRVLVDIPRVCTKRCIHAHNIQRNKLCMGLILNEIKTEGPCHRSCGKTQG